MRETGRPTGDGDGIRPDERAGRQSTEGRTTGFGAGDRRLKLKQIGNVVEIGQQQTRVYVLAVELGPKMQTGRAAGMAVATGSDDLSLGNQIPTGDVDSTEK
ncbi:MAG TPA: hypothetical protein VM754_11075 [Actinomycetota bacterium]|nr:hypothetical protein [Actinomycetota bacterium]